MVPGNYKPCTTVVTSQMPFIDFSSDIIYGIEQQHITVTDISMDKKGFYSVGGVYTSKLQETT